MRGRRRIPTPPSDRIDATCTACSSSSDGSSPGMRDASIVFPAPGGPLIRMLWPPAAATTSASTAERCPTTSTRSATVSSCGGSSAAAFGSCSITSTSAPWARATSPSDTAATTSTPDTISASSRHAHGTTTRSKPAAAAASTAGRTPGIGRSRPSSPSSPMCTVRASDSARIGCSVARAAIAIATSNPAPRFGRLAGDRFTVIRRRGSGNPWLAHALPMRLTASPRALSGSPMRSNPGVCEERSASTSTIAPSSPVSATAQVRTTLIGRPPGVPDRPLPDPPP